MRRIAIVAGLAATAAFLFVGSSSAVKPDAATPTLTVWASQWSSLVEQQSANFLQYNCGVTHDPACDPSTWVVNPNRGCMWDVDDYRNYQGSKIDIPAGVEVATEECLIADMVGPSTLPRHWLWIDLRAASPDLTVTVSVQPGFVQTVAPIEEARNSYRYCAKLTAPAYEQTDPLAVPIPDSNGGWGVPSQMRISIINPSRHTARDVTVVENYGSSGWGLAC